VPIEKIVPPNLPRATTEYSLSFFEQFANALRLYFNRLVNAVNALTTDVETLTGTTTAEGWSDMLAPVSAAGLPPASAPVSTDFGIGSLRKEYRFDVNDFVYIQPFHVNHDVKPNGLAYMHVHWSTNGTSTAAVRWEFQIQRALGHNQAAFASVTTLFITQAASGTAWRHMIAEVVDADAMTLTEPDELLLVTLRRVTNGGVDNTDQVFGLMVDIHYQVDRLATPNKAPNFYG
jgi:hypothetical protein